jgi:glutathione synthase/RimK-type ligase-like ATP-grasp enzyme
LIDVAILTEKRYLNPQPDDWYVSNIIKEDSLVKLALRGLGVSCSRVAWDDNFNPSDFRFALFRTTWNYFEKLDDFMRFLKKCENHISFINPYDQIIWSLDKKYLLFLRNRGINIPETRLVKKGSSIDLKSFCSQNHWEEIVIKPCISAAAWNTHYIKKASSDSQNLISSLVKTQDMLIQVFQKNILTSGEISMMMINGEYSHAVLKKTKPGDFRVQDDFGGTVSVYSPNNREIEFANRVIKALPFHTIYARVDIILDNKGLIALSELELIEPEMWFRLYPISARNLGLAIQGFMTN